MCGRYSLTFIFEGLAEVFNAMIDTLEAVPPRYNVAPTQMLPIITRNNDKNCLQVMRWGLVPSWAKDKTIGSKMINARLETLEEKPAFKSALLRRRCLVPADGYYEWQAIPGSKIKQPYRIVVSERPVFAFAGLWEFWGNQEEGLATYTIVTTAAHPQVASIHDRMPLILTREQEDYWLGGPRAGQRMPEFLGGLTPESQLESYPVSAWVNSPSHDSPECLTPNNDAGSISSGIELL